MAATNKFVHYEDSPTRSKSILPLIRILITSSVQNSDLNHMHEVDVGNYFVWVDGIQVGGFELKHGGTYTAIISEISQYNYVSYDTEYNFVIEL